MWIKIYQVFYLGIIYIANEGHHVRIQNRWLALYCSLKDFGIWILFLGMKSTKMRKKENNFSISYLNERSKEVKKHLYRSNTNTSYVQAGCVELDCSSQFVLISLSQWSLPKLITLWTKFCIWNTAVQIR